MFRAVKQLKSLFLIIALCLCVQNAQALTINEQAPSFTLQPLLEGEQITLQQFQGKVVYLDFWASWCGPCRQSFPFLEQLQQQYQKDGFEVVSINLDENTQAAKGFLEQFSTHFHHAKGFGSDISEKYAISAMPTAYFIDIDGRIRLIHKGFNPNHKNFIKAVLEKLLAER